MDNRSLSFWKTGRKKTYSGKIGLFLFIFICSCVSSQDTAGQKKPQISGATQYGTVILIIPENGILYIDGEKIGPLAAGESKITDILVGKHEFLIKMGTQKIKKMITVSADSTNKIIFNNPDTDIFKGKVPERDVAISEAQKIILDKAFELLDRAPNSVVMVNGKRFVLDCVGTVAAIYYAAGIDLLSDFAPYAGRNGVAKMFNYFEALDVLHQRKLPEVGDIIFWDDTWDFNNDGVFGNDPLTHVGIVTRVDTDGTIHFVHEHIQLGIVVERMNLFQPKTQYDITGKEINSALHAQSGQNKKRNLPWLAGELWRLNGGLLQSAE